MPSTRKHKKKPSPTAWKDVQPVKFENRKWANINRRFGLPDEARALIEHSVSLYSFHHGNHAGFQTPSRALAELKTLESLMQRLSMAFNKMGDRSWYALIDATASADGKTSREMWQARLKNVSEITVDIPEAISIVRGQREKPGANAFALDHLVEQVGNIIHRYNGTRPSRSKLYIDFLLKVANAADPEITADMIEAALKRISKKRN